MTFSYEDYLSHKDFFPRIFTSYSILAKDHFIKLLEKYDREGHKVTGALDAIRQRTSRQYFGKLNSAQIEALSYSEHVFPAYRLILPDAIMDDWMAIVDPHKEHKRDHSLHQPQTAYIVAKLLGFGKEECSLNCPKGRLLSICIDNLSNSKGTNYLRDHLYDLCPKLKTLPVGLKNKYLKDAFYQSCIVSALFHDVGYPWQFINSLDESIEGADFRSVDTFPTDITTIYDSVSDELLLFPFWGYQYSINLSHLAKRRKDTIDIMTKALKKTHGFPGALGFIGLNNSTLSECSENSINDGLYRFVMDYASVGIMMHDMAGLYSKDGYSNFRLSFSKDPLSCIIAMADVFEEFYRPLCGYIHSEENDNVSLVYHMPGESTEIQINNVGEMAVIYKYSDPKCAATSRRFREKEINQYFNNNNSFVDLFELGIIHTDSMTE